MEGGGGRSAQATWGLRLAALLGGLALLYGALALTFGALVDAERVSGWLEPRIEAAVNREVELRGARPVFFPGLGIDLAGLTVHNLSGFEGDPLARIDRIRLRVALLPLLTGRVQVDELDVEGPRIHLAVDADGASNYGDLVPDSGEPSSGSPVEVRIRELRVFGGSAIYSSAPDSVRAAALGIRATASLERTGDGGWTLDLEGASDDVELGHPALGDAPLRLSGPGLQTRARVAPGGASLELDDGELRVGRSTLRLAGRIDDLSAPVRTVDISLEGRDLQLEGLAAALPDSLRARLPGAPEGSVSFALTARGPVGDDTVPSLRGRLDVSDAALTRADGETPVRDVDGRIRLTGDSLAVEELAGTLLGGPFTVAAALALDSTAAVRGRLDARPDLGRAGVLAPLPEGLELEGRADLATGFAGGLRRPAGAVLDGELRLTRLRVGHPRLGVTVAVEGARVELAGRRAAWSDVPVVLDGETVRWSGRVDDLLSGMEDGGEAPLVTTTVTAERLTLDRVLPPRGDTEMTYGRIAFAHLGGRALDGRNPPEVARSEGLARPPPLPVRARAEVRLDTLVAEPYRLADVRARLEAGPELLQVSDASFDLFGGTVRSSLRLGLGPDQRQPFELTLSIEGARAADFLTRSTPVGRSVHGRLGLTLEAAGDVDELLLPVESSLGGGGTFTVREGRIERTPVTATLSRALSMPSLEAPSFRDWRTGFALEGGRLILEDGRLATEAGELRFGGALGLDGSLDLGLGLSVPAARLDSLALGRSGLAAAVAGRIGGDGPARIGLRLGGTLTAPTLRPEASLATGAIAGAVEGELRERAGAVRDTAAARARELADSAAVRAEAAERDLRERARERAEAARERLEDRARGLLRGLTGGGADTTGAGVPAPFPEPDTAAAADTAATPDSTPPDRAPPDTLTPDTAAPDTTGPVLRPAPGPAARILHNESGPGRE